MCYSQTGCIGAGTFKEKQKLIPVFKNSWARSPTVRSEPNKTAQIYAKGGRQVVDKMPVTTKNDSMFERNSEVLVDHWSNKPLESQGALPTAVFGWDHGLGSCL